MFAVFFISYFGERGLKMGQYLFPFKFDSTSRIFLNTRPMNIFSSGKK